MGTEMIGSLFALIHTRCHYTHLATAPSGHNHLELGLIMLHAEPDRLCLDKYFSVSLVWLEATVQENFKNNTLLLLFNLTSLLHYSTVFKDASRTESC